MFYLRTTIIKAIRTRFLILLRRFEALMFLYILYRNNVIIEALLPNLLK